jgi:C4-dicarboxylate-specific signal transduction histidine kinase
MLLMQTAVMACACMVYNDMLCRSLDIVDTMVQKLEKYADNLEALVKQRTSELEDEKQKTDLLLNRMLPR